MGQASRHDAWQAGDSYDLYMGRWSRLVAPAFLDWLAPDEQLDWLDIGCGTGALSAAILDRCNPHSLIGVDRSEAFVERARQSVADSRVQFQVGDAQSPTMGTNSRDVVVSGLVLNFLPDRDKALAEMRRIARSGATVGFYVWAYPDGGVEFMSAFWAAAAELDPRAQELAEDRRFAFCTRDGLTSLAEAAGLASVECTGIEVPTTFWDFEDFWHPFTLGAGPAPGYCMSLEPVVRQRLREKLQRSLPRSADGRTISLNARAWAVRGTVG